jgi:protein required for attachment to host cells
MNKIAIPHDALVFVGDGRKALLLRNTGDKKFPNLITERHAFHGDVKKRILAQIDKDLTKCPVAEIEKHLVA